MKDSERFKISDDLLATPERRAKRLKKAISYALNISMAVEGIYFGAYITPNLIEHARLASSHPYLSELPGDPNTAAETFELGGFGVQNALPIANALTAYKAEGNIEALSYDNQGIDNQVIANLIIEKAHEDNLQSVNLIGESDAGHSVIKIAKIIQEDPSAPTIRLIVLDCTPADANSLQADNQEYLRWLQNLSTVLPDIAASPAISFLHAEQRVRANPMSGGKASLGAVASEMWGIDQPSSELLRAEALEVVDPTLENDLKDIAKVTTKFPPLVVTIRPKSDTADSMVNSSVSDKKLSDAITGAGLTHLGISLDNIGHADPTATPEPYNIAITNIILPALNEYERGLRETAAEKARLG